VNVSKILFLSFNNFANEKLKELKRNKKEARIIQKEIQEIKDSLPATLKKFNVSEIETGHFYVQVIDHLKNISNSLYHIILPALTHVDNNHPLDREQQDELTNFSEQLSDFFNYVLNLLKKGGYEDEKEVIEKRDKMIEMINDIIVSRIKILKKKRKGVKVSITYIEMLTETKSLVLHIYQLIKANTQLNESFVKTNGMKV
jgi:Na+/phosphate symporter